MSDLITYLFFDGKCREAMSFYEKCLGGRLNAMTYAQGPQHCPEGGLAPSDRIMHAHLETPKGVLMASDVPPGSPYQLGGNFAVSVNCKTEEEIERLFGAVGEGGEITMALQDVFWGARFGMLKDQFGIHWMFNYEKPKQA